MALDPREALRLGEVPLLKIKTVRDKRREFKLTRLAKEYIIDFDIIKAAARAECEWSVAKTAERDRFFIQITQELLEMVDPEKVITRQEILMGLRKEAHSAKDSSDRIKAFTALAKLTGMELPADAKPGSNAPVINLTLHQTSPL